MNTPYLTLRTFGIPMQRRAVRRRLVVVTYAILAALCALTAWLVQTHGTGFSLALYPALAVGTFVFGGQGQYGLIKAFPNRPPRQEAPVVELVKLRLAPEFVTNSDPALWKNDERELARRDRAHYTAFQPLAVAWIGTVLLAAWALKPPHWLSLNTILSLLFVLTLAGTVLAVTLPAAIILWNEPDMESPVITEGD